jgi:NTE family protein
MTSARLKKEGSVEPGRAKGQRYVISPEVAARPESSDKKVALVLEGRGALGSYQAGVYESLSTSQYLPDWVAGISIGAINAAIIADDPPEKRVACLRDFGERITAPAPLWPLLGRAIPSDRRRLSSVNALLPDRPGFFAPRLATGWLFGVMPTRHYDTSALKGTLEWRISTRSIPAKSASVSVR